MLRAFSKAAPVEAPAPRPTTRRERVAARASASGALRVASGALLSIAEVREAHNPLYEVPAQPAVLIEQVTSSKNIFM